MMPFTCVGDLPNTGHYAYLFTAYTPRDTFTDIGRHHVARYPGVVPLCAMRTGQPIYAGSTFRLRSRIHRHIAKSSWCKDVLELNYFPIRSDSRMSADELREKMLQAERWLICTFKPLHNKAIPSKAVASPDDILEYFDLKFKGSRTAVCVDTKEQLLAA
jgi:hypothetical protein